MGLWMSHSHGRIKARDAVGLDGQVRVAELWNGCMRSVPVCLQKV